MIEDVGDACTSPERLARWLSPVTGDHHLPGQFAGRSHVPAADRPGEHDEPGPAAGVGVRHSLGVGGHSRCRGPHRGGDDRRGRGHRVDNQSSAAAPTIRL